MTTGGARALREDHQDMSREDVLLQWERKIEAAEARPGRFERPAARADTPTAPAADHEISAQAPAPPAPRFERAAVATGQRRTITITGRPTPARRLPGVAARQLAQPDRVALWAFLLGLFLVAVAAGTAHA
jgi:hypothetical protein